MMDLIILGVFLVAIVLFVLAKPRNRRIAEQFPYSLTKNLFSNAEQSFYSVLVQAVGGTGLVLAKVRVADVMTPKEDLNRSDWQKAFNAVSAKHFDFLVCDPNDCSVLLAVELDDSSHNSKRSRKRDALIDDACSSAGLPLLRVKAAQGYVIAEIRRTVEGLISPGSAQSSETTSPTPALTTQTASNNHSAIFATPLVKHESSATQKPPSCPKCQVPMVYKNGKAGVNEGKAFWLCSTYPKCRAAKAIKQRL